MAKPKTTTGGCQCGAVRYRVSGSLRDVVNCHCRECQRLNGNFGSHSKARSEDIAITEDKGLAWYQISANARRGFCRNCGASLFWEASGQPGTGIIAGSLDDTSELHTLGHIFVSEKAGYYEITDGLPQFEKSSEGGFSGDEV